MKLFALAVCLGLVAYARGASKTPVKDLTTVPTQTTESTSTPTSVTSKNSSVTSVAPVTSTHLSVTRMSTVTNTNSSITSTMSPVTTTSKGGRSAVSSSVWIVLAVAVFRYLTPYY